ncbi:UFD1 [Mytilus coruscus]|uniref:UFD1 n=1 Tax=Mytilus coruscus TaxID=42192 RepID=A0A6J8CZP4_MYTCO|nr:UFD1 [Mytilus coruscus]
MPSSALDRLVRLPIQYPMLFKLMNNQQARHTHCGVLEFVADEGRIYIPYWMMRNLLLNEGDLVEVENVSLKVATFTKFQPQSVDFLDIIYPKAMIKVHVLFQEYELCVLKTKPDDAVSIIECDINIGRFGGNIFGTELSGGLSECKQTYTCYSMIMLNDREDVDMLERGGKRACSPKYSDGDKNLLIIGRFGGNIFGTELSGGLGECKQTYTCYSMIMLNDREDVDMLERGGKIIMPPSAVDQLIRLHIVYPMLFKLRNNQQARHTHCGVLEFVAEEDRIYIPTWMMRNLLLNDGDTVEVENVLLKVATFTKFQPQSVDFLDIINPADVYPLKKYVKCYY